MGSRFFGTKPQEINCRVFALITIFAICFFPLPSLVLLLAIVLSWLPKLFTLIEKLVAITSLLYYNFINTHSNANLR
jgi:putative flippase GtrA